MKKIFKKTYILFSKMVMTLFYDNRYLKGRWFDNSIKGWKWCWRAVFMQKIIGINKHVPFPVSFRNKIGKPENIHFSPNDINNFQHFGCYYQSYRGHIYIGEGTYIAPNVGLITENHDISNLDLHTKSEDIVIGRKCWIGMNSMILPGVEIGDNTIVGAGSIVTKSFKEGNCIIVGNPAKKIKIIEENDIDE